jgi:hypothetical protein
MLAAVQAGCICTYFRISGSFVLRKFRLTQGFLIPQSLLSPIGYFLKNIDLNNVKNAHHTGMEEDLKMCGNQLVTITSVFMVA